MLMYVCIYVACPYLDELRVVAALLFRSPCRTATAAAAHPMHVMCMYVRDMYGNEHVCMYRRMYI